MYVKKNYLSDKIFLNFGSVVRSNRNTFLLYWMITKIFGIMDAYVDAQLANYNVEDFTPEELKKE